MSVRLPAFAWLVLLLLPGAVVAGHQYRDPAGRYTIAIPEEFEPFAETPPGFDAMYVKPPSGGQQLPGVIFVKRLGGLLRQEDISADVAKRSSEARTSTERWRSFDVNVVHVPETVDGVPGVNLNAQLPLAPEAVQVGAFGEAAAEADVRDLLRQVLGGVEGEARWAVVATPEQPVSATDRVSETTGRVAAYAIIGAALFAVLGAWRKRKATEPSGAT